MNERTTVHFGRSAQRIYSRARGNVPGRYGVYTGVVAAHAYESYDEACKARPHFDSALVPAARQIEAALGEGFKVRLREVSTQWVSLTERVDDRVAHVSAVLRVEKLVAKPSLIVEDMAPLLEAFASAGVDEIVRSAMRKAVAAAEQARVLEEHTHWANHLVDGLAERARKAAREACRFDQRYAGLLAELESEKQAQAAKLVAEAEADERTWKFSDGVAIPDRVRAAALRVLTEAVKNGESGFPRLDRKQWVKPEDVQPEDAK
jgi:hypothetical protein